MSKEFTGVFIPAHIWESRELIPAEKMLLGEIAALSQRSGWCSASRAHFAEWLRCDPTNVSHYVAKLEKLGFLEVSRTPGERSKMRVVIDRFYVEPVNGVHGGSEWGSRVVVNGVHGGSEWGSPEIQDKEKEEIKLKTLSRKSENSFGLKPVEQAPPVPPAPPAEEQVNDLQNAIETAMRYTQEQPAQVKYWFDCARISGWTPERLKQEIALFFSYYFRTLESPHHICRKNPRKFFADGFLGWLMKCDKNAATKSNTGQPEKKRAVNDAQVLTAAKAGKQPF